MVETGSRDSRHGKHFLMGLLQGVGPLLEFQVLIGELGLERCSSNALVETATPDWPQHEQEGTRLVLDLTKLLLGELDGARRKRRELRAKVAVVQSACADHDHRREGQPVMHLREVLAKALEIHLGDAATIRILLVRPFGTTGTLRNWGEAGCR